MILTYRRPGPPDTHAMSMVNNVIEVLNYVIAAHPLPLNSVIADKSHKSAFRAVPTSSPRTRRHSAAHPSIPAKIETKTSLEQANADGAGCWLG